MIQCFVARKPGQGWEFLQLLRSAGRYMAGTWQLVSGQIEAGETGPQAAIRELREETGLVPAEFYQLDVVNTFYLAKDDGIWMVPLFCAIVSPDAAVRLNDEHDDCRWVAREELAAKLMWPGEGAAFDELCRQIIDDGPAKLYLRIPHSPK